MRKKRVLVFVIAYQAEETITNVVQRIPPTLRDDYDVDVLIIDDSSRDKTFERSHELTKRSDIPFNVRLLVNRTNQGYGGNQKLGFRYAIDNAYDFVALLHGDGKYAPESLPSFLKPLVQDGAAAVLGYRHLSLKEAIREGVPLGKLVGKKLVRRIQNRLLGSHLTEFHSGCRIYSVDALRSLPFERNADDFRFDTEIIIQLIIAQLRIVELPTVTYSDQEVRSTNGLRYAAGVLKTTLFAKLQDLSLFYDRRYDCSPVPLSQYSPKFNFESPHSFTLNSIPPGSAVLDLGCAGGYMAFALKEQKHCRVVGVDASPLSRKGLDGFYLRDLNNGVAEIPVESHDFVLLLDVIEHLLSPEKFLDELRSRMSLNPESELIISTGNVSFIVTRLMLILGQFNYGKRGILDLTHTRLFTFASLARALEQAGFAIKETKAIPAPFPLALGNNRRSRTLVKLNSILTRISPTLFGYQMIVCAKPLPTVDTLLNAAFQESREKVHLLEKAAVAGKY